MGKKIRTAIATKHTLHSLSLHRTGCFRAAHLGSVGQSIERVHESLGNEAGYASSKGNNWTKESSGTVSIAAMLEH